MHRAPFICDAKCRAGAVDSPPNCLVRPRNRSFVRRLVLPREKENVKRTQSSGVATQKRLRINAGGATTMSAEAKFLGVEAAEARPRKSSGNSLQDMLSHRFGGISGTEKKRSSSKKQSPSRARSAKPPGLTLDRIDPQTLREWEKSFEALLRSKEGSQLFEEFLKSEFSEENILFWRACEDYRNSPESALASAARSIFDEFISQEASKLVNIDHQTTKEIIESMKVPTRDTFAKAQHSIYLLMARDSYVRFIKSDSFKAALSS